MNIQPRLVTTAAVIIACSPIVVLLAGFIFAARGQDSLAYFFLGYACLCGIAMAALM